jgi:hypothetical protein
MAIKDIGPERVARKKAKAVGDGNSPRCALPGEFSWI